jgi:GntR family transcriptional regulator, transcriptional repressor for pyruvate dehydrogenase complex
VATSSDSDARSAPGYEAVRLRVRDYMRTAGLSPGDRLPPERQLAHDLGVSRNTLREALMTLRIEGLIDVQHGSGAYLLRTVDDVVPPINSALRIGDPLLPAVGEVRNGLEALAARLAAIRRNDRDLEEMVAANRQMRDEIVAGETGVTADRRFHSAVVAAARNAVLADLSGAVSESAARIAAASLAREGQPPRSLAAHRLIFEAIAAREPGRAAETMYEHLDLTGEISG